MNVLVTGGTGFIGRNLLEAISKKQWSPYVLVSDYDNIDMISNVDRVSFISAKEFLEGNYRTTNGRIMPTFDCCINLAAAGVSSQETLTNLVEGNFLYTIKVLERCKSLGVGKFIHIGSCFEYGQAQRPNLINEENKIDPFSMYGVTKAAASTLVISYGKVYDMPTVVLRPFGTYGKYENKNRLLPQIMKSLIKSKPLEMTSGDQIRDFMNVSDLVDAILSFATVTVFEKSAYNVCTSRALSVKDFALHVFDILGGDASLLRFGKIPKRSGEPDWIVGDNRELLKALNWIPSVDLEKGIQDTFEWFQKEHGG